VRYPHKRKFILEVFHLEHDARRTALRLLWVWLRKWNDYKNEMDLAAVNPPPETQLEKRNTVL